MKERWRLGREKGRLCRTFVGILIFILSQPLGTSNLWGQPFLMFPFINSLNKPRGFKWIAQSNIGNSVWKLKFSGFMTFRLENSYKESFLKEILLVPRDFMLSLCILKFAIWKPISQLNLLPPLTVCVREVYYSC